jgi:hypothetical protein
MDHVRRKNICIQKPFVRFQSGSCNQGFFWIGNDRRGGSAAAAIPKCYAVASGPQVPQVAAAAWLQKPNTTFNARNKAVFSEHKHRIWTNPMDSSHSPQGSHNLTRHKGNTFAFI